MFNGIKKCTDFGFLNIEQIQDRAIFYMQETLSEKERDRFEEHMDACEYCSKVSIKDIQSWRWITRAYAAENILEHIDKFQKSEPTGLESKFERLQKLGVNEIEPKVLLKDWIGEKHSEYERYKAVVDEFYK